MNDHGGLTMEVKPLKVKPPCQSGTVDLFGHLYRNIFSRTAPPPLPPAFVGVITIDIIKPACWGGGGSLNLAGEKPASLCLG